MKLNGQPTIILYSWGVTFRTGVCPSCDETQKIYGLYNTRTKEIKLSREGFGRWPPAIPEAYSEAIVLLKRTV